MPLVQILDGLQVHFSFFHVFFFAFLLLNWSEAIYIWRFKRKMDYSCTVECCLFIGILYRSCCGLRQGLTWPSGPSRATCSFTITKQQGKITDAVVRKLLQRQLCIYLCNLNPITVLSEYFTLYNGSQQYGKKKRTCCQGIKCQQVTNIKI